MALTLRANGNGATNLITAQWFNDFYNLFTGVMLDQPVTFRPNVTHQAIAGPPAAPTLSLTSGANLSVGGYQYGVTLVSADGGETLLGTTASITTTTGNQGVNISGIPVDSTNAATKRNLYRTKVGGTTFYLLHTINDNTTTSYADAVNDTGLSTTTAPAHPTFGGALFFKDQNGNPTLTIANDGALIGNGGSTSFGNTTINGTAQLNSTLSVVGTSYLAAAQLYGPLTMQPGQAISANGITATSLAVNSSQVVVNGTTNGTATLYTLNTGVLKVYYLYYNNYENNTGSEQKLTLPQAYTTRVGFFALGGNPATHFYSSGSQLSGKCSIITALPSGSGAGGQSTQNGVNGFSTGEVTSGFDQIGLGVNGTQTLSGGIIFIGV